MIDDSYEQPPTVLSLKDCYTEDLFSVPGLYNRTRLIRPEGNGASGVMVMGEAAGENEAKDRLPFRPYAQAGSILERGLREIGISRSVLTLTNAVMWQPANNQLVGRTWELSALRASRPINLQLMEKANPRVLVALGRTAFQELTGITEVSVLNGRGMIYNALPIYNKLPVVLSYHPSFINRGSGKEREKESGLKDKKAQGGMSLFGSFKRDLKLALSIARSGVPNSEVLDGVMEPTDDLWQTVYQECLDNPNILISYDFETAYSIITAAGDEEEYTEEDLMEVTQFQITVSNRPYLSLIANWSPRVEQWCRKFMALPNPKLDVNGRFFDRQLLRMMDIPMNGNFIDLQSLWCHLQPDLPRNLQFIASFSSPQYSAWKHLMGVDMVEYGKHDSIRPIMAYDWILQTLGRLRHPEGIPCDQSYWKYTNQVEQKCLDSYTRRGIPIDRERQLAVGRELQQAAEATIAEILPLVPEEIVKGEQKEGLAGPPEEWAKEVRALRNQAEARLKKAKREAKAALARAKKGIVPLLEEERLADEMAAREVAEAQLDYDNFVELLEKGPEGNRWTTKTEEEEEIVYVKRTLRVIPKAKKLKDGTIQPALEPFTAERWQRLEQFNPNSTHQMIKWIEWNRQLEINQLVESRGGKPLSQSLLNSLKWKVPMVEDEYTKEPKPTTDKGELVKLLKKTGCPVIKNSLTAREISKLIGTYVGSGKKEGE